MFQYKRLKYSMKISSRNAIQNRRNRRAQSAYERCFVRGWVSQQIRRKDYTDDLQIILFISRFTSGEISFVVGWGVIPCILTGGPEVCGSTATPKTQIFQKYRLQTWQFLWNLQTTFKGIRLVFRGNILTRLRGTHSWTSRTMKNTYDNGAVGNNFSNPRTPSSQAMSTETSTNSTSGF